MQPAFHLIRQTYASWSDDKAPRLAAALAFYTVFSLAPLLIIVIQIVALILGGGQASGHHQAVRAMIFGSLAGSVGRESADALRAILDATIAQRKVGIVAAILSWAILLFGAVGLFGALQDALNTVWCAEAKPRGGLIAMVWQRVASFSMIAGIAFVLLVSLAINTALSALSQALTRAQPALAFAGHALDFVISLAVITLLFALIYKYLPDVEVEWRDVWTGALITAILFVVGQFVLSWYLGRASTSSTYGAAGSLVVLLLWVYYSAQILLFGAEFTKVYAERFGSRIGNRIRDGTDTLGGTSEASRHLRS